jgi:hypothetical protein
MNTKDSSFTHNEITSIFFLGHFHDDAYPLRKQH